MESQEGANYYLNWGSEKLLSTIIPPFDSNLGEARARLIISEVGGVLEVGNLLEVDLSILS